MRKTTKVGDIFDLGPYDVTRNEIIEFARKYDLFPLHIDDKAAQATVVGGLISSTLVWLRLKHEAVF